MSIWHLEVQARFPLLNELLYGITAEQECRILSLMMKAEKTSFTEETG